MDAPPNDPEEWSDEQWQEYLRSTAGEDVDSEAPGPVDGATGFRRLRSSSAGSIVGAGMMGLEQAIYGERPKEEVVAEAESDDPDRDHSHFDPDDPSSATLSLVVDPSPPVPGRRRRHRLTVRPHDGGPWFRCPWGG